MLIFSSQDWSFYFQFFLEFSLPIGPKLSRRVCERGKRERRQRRERERERDRESESRRRRTTSVIPSRGHGYCLSKWSRSISAARPRKIRPLVRNMARKRGAVLGWIISRKGKVISDRLETLSHIEVKSGFSSLESSFCVS